MAVIGLALAAFIVAGIIFGWVAFFRVRDLERRVDQLSAQMQTGAAVANVPADLADAPAAAADEPAPLTPVAEEQPAAPLAPATEHTSSVPPRAPQRAAAGNWRNQWMVWLGGLCVAMAGVFMVRYSIERGLLGPQARVTAGTITGVALHVVAEWLRRQRGANPAFAALAGGATITVFAALLAALHLYQLLPANLVFALLAMVSLATMALALRHGPALAAIGLLGGYAVPLLVSSASDNVVAAMVYALIISAAGLLLLRYVYRTWLWWGLIAGILGWWLVSLPTGDADDFRGIYLALAAYAVIAIPRLDWLLQRVDCEPPGERRGPWPRGPFHPVVLALAMLTAAWGIALFHQGIDGLSVLQWGPLVVVIGLAARNCPALNALPWFSLLAAWLAIALSQLQMAADSSGYTLTTLAPADSHKLLVFALQMALVYLTLGGLAQHRRPFTHAWYSLATLAPLVWLALGYLLTGDLSGSWRWSLSAIVAGLCYALLSGLRLEKHPADQRCLWLVLASHSAYSLAVAMYFREAGLTVALAAQLVSLAWLARRYPLPWLDWLVKIVLAVVVVRLSFNPWLLRYPSDIHWSLWTYGGSTACTAIAAWLVGRKHPLRAWLEAAGLHLLVLTLGAELRYWLYDGDIFRARYSLTEAAINSCLWAALGLSYFNRAKVSTNLARLYVVMSSVLLVMAAASYGLSVTLLNPLWSDAAVSSRPFLNILLPAYGFPALLALLVYRYHLPELKPLAGLVAAAGTLLFVSLEIRHLWQGAVSLSRSTGNGELYTYSAVWLLMAVAMVIAGSLWRNTRLNQGGLALLALVIVKIFLLDMSGLEGLLRVASFMGLGLSLLGLAYLRSRLPANAQPPPFGASANERRQ